MIYSAHLRLILIILLRWASVLLTAAFRHLTCSHQQFSPTSYLSFSLILPHSLTFYLLLLFLFTTPISFFQLPRFWEC